jgi:hypothetical protein
MRLIFVDRKTNTIEESPQRFPSLVDAIAALDRLISQGLTYFGQVLDHDGKVLANRAPIRPDNAPATDVATTP